MMPWNAALLVIWLMHVLPVLSGGNTTQQDLLCTNSYSEFESTSVASNISGNDLRRQLRKVFYSPNQHLPYSVVVTYQLVFANGTRLNLSSDEGCSSEIWVWMSSPVFLLIDITYLNRGLLFTLNYFREWNPPHVVITTTTVPCHAYMKDFLTEMTASVSLCSMSVYLNHNTKSLVPRNIIIHH